MDKDPFDEFEINHGKRFKTDEVNIFSAISRIANKIEDGIEHIADKVGIKAKHHNAGVFKCIIEIVSE